MKRSWGSTDWGKVFTRTEEWRLRLEGDKITIEVAEKTYNAHILGAKAISAKPGIFWASVSFIPKGASPIKLDGIPNSNAEEMLATLRASLTEYENAIAKKQRIQKFEKFLTPVIEWRSFVGRAASNHKKEKRWISEE